MKFRHLALKNVKGNWHQYIAFFLSCTFSVMIFYIFASFIYHPDVINGHIRGGETTRSGMLACEYIIMIFSFFFVMYSESAFIKSRKKEFGLLSLFGMTGGQVKRLVFYENMLIAVLSVFSGLVFGTLFSKLFLMVMSELLHVTSPIGFQIVPKAVIITVIGFLAIFFFITLFQLFRVGRSEIIELLKASRKPKSLPVFSRWLVGLTIVALGTGYVLAFISTAGMVIFLMFPVLGLVVLGTYFLFTQGSVAVLRSLRKNRAIFYKRTNFITLSQLIFKMKDNARVLFTVTILSAVVLTASGTFYIFYQGLTNTILRVHPQTFGFVEKGLHSHRVVDPQRVEQILKQDDVDVKSRVKVAGVPVTIQPKNGQEEGKTFLLVSNETYNGAVKTKNVDKVNIEKGQTRLIYTGPSNFLPFEEGDQIKTTVDGEKLGLHLNEVSNKGIVNLDVASGLLVINNQQYQQLTASIPAQKIHVAYGYELKNWQSTQETIEKIKNMIPEDQKYNFSSRVEPYLSAKQFTSLTMFIGIFVSVLFFIAAGSMIYFKLFTELEEDRAQFQSLRRIGVTEREIKKIVTKQVGMVFFIPFVVGAVHALFAYKMFQNIAIFGDVWKYGGIVIGIFFVMQFIYFLITRQTYIRQVVRN